VKPDLGENSLELLPAEIEEMFPSLGEVTVFAGGSPLTGELTSYLIQNDVNARPCYLNKQLGKYSHVEKSAEIFILPLLISYFSDPNVNQVLCNLLAAYIYDRVTNWKKMVRGAIGQWREPEKILSVRGYRCRDTESGVEIKIDNISTNCYSPKEIAEILKRPQKMHKEDIVVGIVQAIIVGINPLGNTDISHLTEAAVLNKIRSFVSLSVDDQREKIRSTMRVVKVFNPATTSSISRDGSYMQVAIPTDLCDILYRSAMNLGLGNEFSERFDIIAVAVSQ